jgi:hypothetical protein
MLAAPQLLATVAVGTSNTRFETARVRTNEFSRLKAEEAFRKVNRASTGG